MFDIRAGKCIQTFKESNKFDPIKSFEFSSSGRLIFAIGKNNNMKVWDTLSKDGEIFQSIEFSTLFLPEFSSEISQIRLSEQKNLVALLGKDYHLKVFCKDKFESR